MSARVWEGARPLLEPHHAVLALTALGHRGGPVPSRRPVRVGDLVDATERLLDERGLERAHVAGNSMGGWMAIELARRGRALTVCALSPAGSWTAGTREQSDSVRRIRRSRWLARRGRAFPALMRSDRARRLALREIAEHGERLTPAEAVDTAEDLLRCAVLDDIVDTDEEIAPLHPLPCPVTLAWAGRDRLLPPAVNGAVAHARLPDARFIVLPGVGHVPMIDDHALVARTILEAASRPVH